MKVILIFASSINGYIAESNNSVHWSDEVWKAYQSISHNIGNMIVGRLTYELMIQSGEIDTLGLRNLIIISGRLKDQKYKVMPSPKESLEYLESLGEKEVIVCGGASVATTLIDNNLLDEIILDIDPVIISDGLSMFNKLKVIPKLELIETKVLCTHTVRIHYRVIH